MRLIHIVVCKNNPFFTHSSVLAWRIPGMGEPGGLPSMGSHRVRHNWSDLAAAAVFDHMDIPHLICLFINWFVFELFPAFWLLKVMLLWLFKSLGGYKSSLLSSKYLGIEAQHIGFQSFQIVFPPTKHRKSRFFLYLG